MSPLSGDPCFQQYNLGHPPMYQLVLSLSRGPSETQGRSERKQTSLTVSEQPPVPFEHLVCPGEVPFPFGYFWVVPQLNSFRLADWCLKQMALTGLYPLSGHLIRLRLRLVRSLSHGPSETQGRSELQQKSSSVVSYPHNLGHPNCPLLYKLVLSLSRGPSETHGRSKFWKFWLWSW